MLHPRTLIRKAVIDILKGKTLAGDRVFSNRSIPATEENLPIVHVFTLSEDIDEYSQAPRALARALSLVVEVIARGTKDAPLEDCLDEISMQIEQTLSLDDTLNRTCDDCILSSVSFETVDDGALPIGSCRLTFTVKYVTDMPNSVEDQAVNLRELKTVGASWNIDTNNDQDDPDGVLEEAKDTIILPQV